MNSESVWYIGKWVVNSLDDLWTHVELELQRELNRQPTVPEVYARIKDELKGPP